MKIYFHTPFFRRRLFHLKALFRRKSRFLIAPHFHFMHTVKAAEPESIRQPAQRRRKKRQRPDFDAPVFRLSALARVIRTQAAKKKGRKIDVDPAFPPEIRGVSDADLASTSAESPPARRPGVHQFKKVG